MREILTYITICMAMGVHLPNLRYAVVIPTIGRSPLNGLRWMAWLANQVKLFPVGSRNAVRLFLHRLLYCQGYQRCYAIYAYLYVMHHQPVVTVLTTTCVL